MGNIARKVKIIKIIKHNTILHRKRIYSHQCCIEPIACMTDVFFIVFSQAPDQSAEQSSELQLTVSLLLCCCACFSVPAFLLHYVAVLIPVLVPVLTLLRSATYLFARWRYIHIYIFISHCTLWLPIKCRTPRLL